MSQRKEQKSKREKHSIKKTKIMKRRKREESKKERARNMGEFKIFAGSSHHVHSMKNKT